MCIIQMVLSNVCYIALVERNMLNSSCVLTMYVYTKGVRWYSSPPPAFDCATSELLTWGLARAPAFV